MSSFIYSDNRDNLGFLHAVNENNCYNPYNGKVIIIYAALCIFVLISTFWGV